MEAIEKIEENYGGGHYNAPDVRKTTTKIHDLMDEGIMDPRGVADAALAYMSESEVHDMARANDWLYGMGDEDEEGLEEDTQTYSIANDDVELALTRAAQALAKDAVDLAAEVWDEEGDAEGWMRTGAQNRHQYVQIAAQDFLDKEYKRSIIAYLEDKFDDAIKQELQDYNERR